MKKKICWAGILCVFLCLGLLSGCNDDDDDTKSDSELIGSWIANYSEDDCIIINEWSFSNDNTFIFHCTESCEGDDGYECTNKGTWEVRDGFLYTTNTEVTDPNDDEIGVEYKLMYFITSTEKLAITDYIHTRTGSGTGIAGEWKSSFDDGGCQEILIFNSNGTFSAEEVCPGGDEDEPFSGTYTIDGDRMNANFTSENGPETFKGFYKIVDSNLINVPEEELFSKD